MHPQRVQGAEPRFLFSSFIKTPFGGCTLRVQRGSAPFFIIQLIQNEELGMLLRVLPLLEGMHRVLLRVLMGMLNGITADSAAESASFSEETVSENVLLRLLPLIHSL